MFKIPITFTVEKLCLVRSSLLKTSELVSIQGGCSTSRTTASSMVRDLSLPSHVRLLLGASSHNAVDYSCFCLCLRWRGALSNCSSFVKTAHISVRFVFRWDGPTFSSKYFSTSPLSLAYFSDAKHCQPPDSYPTIHALRQPHSLSTHLVPLSSTVYSVRSTYALRPLLASCSSASYSSLEQQQYSDSTSATSYCWVTTRSLDVIAHSSWSHWLHFYSFRSTADR